MNVLKRIVIPRTNLSVGYILTELEEMAREEFHRLKKVKEKKRKDYELRHKKDVPQNVCRICGEEQEKPEIQIAEQPRENIEPIPVIAITPESAEKPYLIPSKIKSDTSEKELPPKVKIQQEPEPFVELYVTASAKSSVTVVGTIKNIEEDRLEYLKSHLNELIALGKEFVQIGVDQIDINEFLNMCEDAKLKLEQFFIVDNDPKVDTKLERKLEHLKCHLREVIDITKEFKPEAKLTSSVENFLKMCEDVDEKLDIYKHGIPSPSKTVDNDKERLEEFKDIITDVENITKEYNKKGLLSPSAEAFLQSCFEMKSKVDKYMGRKKNRVTISEQPSLEKQREPSIEKQKQPSIDKQKQPSIEKHKQLSIEKQKSYEQPAEKETSGIHSEIQHLIKHIDETIDLGIEAREEGLISGSVEDIIKSFDEIKPRITRKDEKPKKLQNLQLNIEEIMKMTNRLRTGGIVTASVEDFLKLCKETLNKLNVSEIRSQSTLGNPSKANLCIDSCTINTGANLTKVGSTKGHKEIPLLIDVAPCDSCSGVVRIKDISKESVCATCSQHEEDEDTLRSQMHTVLNSPDESQEIVYEPSKKNVLQHNITENKKPPLEIKTESSPTSVDSKLGYFEKKLQKIVKVTRTQQSDGTICEHKETITIKKEKHDPTETSLADDDDDDDVTDDTSDNNINEQVNICIQPTLAQRGFIRSVRQTRSDSDCKHTYYIEPRLRCLSVDNVCLTMREQMSFYDANNMNEIELLDTDLNNMSCLRPPLYTSQNQ